MSVRFRYDTTDFKIQNPSRSNTLTPRHFQAQARSAGGKLYTYKKGITIKTVLLSFSELRSDEKVLLVNFFNVDAEAGLNKFLYTDHHGHTWNAQFLTDELVFTEVDDYKASADTFTIGPNTYPTTLRKDGIWQVDIEMELI